MLTMPHTLTHPYMMPHTPYPSLYAHHATHDYPSLHDATHAYPSFYTTAGQAPAFAASWQGKKVLTEVRKTKKFWPAPVSWLGCGGPLVGVRAGWCHAMCGRVLTAQEKMQKFLLKKQRKRAAKKRVAKGRVAHSRNPPLRGPTSEIVTG